LPSSTTGPLFPSSATQKPTTRHHPTHQQQFLPTFAALALGAGGLYYARENDLLPAALAKSSSAVDYAAVKKAIADAMESNDKYDDGSYGPVLVRLAWHSAGTYDKATNSGGSDGATMRFAPESNHGANAGLAVARDLLEPIKKKFPAISYADLYTLAGAVAIEEMGGPVVPWRPGRSDAADGSACPPDGRLPDASKDAKHVRDVFEKRMGFSARETVALLGAHALGRCHADRSGFVGPWTRSPTSMGNSYFTVLLEETWRKKKWSGPVQYENASDGTLMMLPTDMALIWDKGYKKYVEEFARDADAFDKAFAAAFGKLLELGCKF
jgi:cytochrome c peroxidase